MSGTRNIVLSLSTRGAEKLRSDLEGMGAAGEAALKRLDDAVRRHEANGSRLSGANDNAGRSFGSLGSQVQNASFQLGDFFVQVASGQSAITALAQQLPQLLGGFGAIGAASGAAVAIGAVAYNMLAGADAAKEMDKALKEHEAAYRAVEEAAKRRRAGLEEEATAIVNLTTYYGSLTEAQRRGELVILNQQRARLEQTGREQAREIGTTIRDRADNPTYGIAPGDMIGDAGASALGAVPEGVQRAADALARLDDANNRTREGIREVIADLQAAAQGSGTFATAITAARDEVIRLAPELERNGAAVQQVRQQIEAADPALAILGNGSNKAAREVATLSGALAEAASRIATLRREAAENPYADLDRTVATLRAQGEALARGDNDAAEAIERREQARTRNAAERAKMLEQEAAALRAINTSEEDIAAARSVSDRRIAQQQGEIFRQQEANREQEKRNREAEAAAARAAAAARSASGKALTEQVREEAAAQRERDKMMASGESIRRANLTASERYAEHLEELNTLLKEGAINQETFNREARRADPATREAEERTKKLEAEARRSYETQQREAERTFDRITDYAGDAFADIFLNTEGGWEQTMKRLERTAVATFARIVFEAAARPIIMPIVQQFVGVSGGGAGGGATGTVLQAVGGAPGGQAGGTGANGVTGYAQQGMQAYGMYDKFKGGLEMFSPNYNWNSNSIVGGFDRTFETGIGNWLNTPTSTMSWGPAVAAGWGASTNSAVTAATMVNSPWLGGVGAQQAGAFAGASASNAATSVPTGTIGGTLGGGLAAIGGAYSAYEGFKRGGVGGNIQGVGGTAMAGMGTYAAIAGSMTAVPVWGWIAAAALMVIGALLPGQKPSDRTGTYTFNTRTGEGTEGGLTGDRFSGENREQAAEFSKAINNLATQIGEIAGLPGAVDVQYRVGVGARDGLQVAIGNYGAQGSMDEAGIEAVTRAVSAKFLQLAAEQTPDENVRKVINASGTGDIDVTMANLDWYKNTYKELNKTSEEVAASTNQFAEAMKALRAPFDEAITKAKEFGLATETIAERQKEATDKLVKERDQTLKDIFTDISDRVLVATGGDTFDRQMQVYYRQQDAQRRAMEEQVRQLGAGANVVQDVLRAMVGAMEAEAEAMKRQYEGALLTQERDALRGLSSQGNVLTTFLNREALTDASPQQQFLAAQETYRAALERASQAEAHNADLGSVTSAASELLKATGSFYGEGAEAALIRTGVTNQVRALGADLGLPGFSDSAKVEQTLNRWIEVSTDSTAALEGLRDEVNALREEMRLQRIVKTDDPGTFINDDFMRPLVAA